jgi:hypothetical protein
MACVSPPPVLIELWNVCTRPEKDTGFGKSITATDRYWRFLESFVRMIAGLQG